MKVFFLPENLNLDDFIQNNPPTFRCSKDDLKYLISTIIRLKKDRKEYLEAGFVPLNAQILQSRVRAYNHCLNYLMINEVIEINGSYTPGKNSRSYRLTKKYSGSEIKLENITTRTFLPRRSTKTDDNRFKKEYAFLVKWFNTCLQVDVKNADRYLKFQLAKEEKSGVENAREKYVIHTLNLNNINRGLFNLSVDDTGKRFHSNLTSLKSILRNYLTYNGEALCSIDVKNSQPFISTIVLNPKFYEKTKGAINLYTISPTIYKLVETEIPFILSILPPIHINMIVKDHENLCRSDIELFVTLVDKGRLYPYLSEKYFDKTGIRLDINIPDQKSKLKEMIFMTMFSRNGFYNQKGAEMKRFFSKQFPTVFKVFTLLKEKQHNLLPVILQLVESEIVLRRTAKSISKAKPNLPIFTIHDSIATTIGNEEIIWQTLKQEFESAIGLQPSLSKEFWDTEKVRFIL